MMIVKTEIGMIFLFLTTHYFTLSFNVYMRKLILFLPLLTDKIGGQMQNYYCYLA